MAELDPSENCALGADGQLKDAADIDWFESEGEDQPLHAAPVSASKEADTSADLTGVEPRAGKCARSMAFFHMLLTPRSSSSTTREQNPRAARRRHARSEAYVEGSAERRGYIRYPRVLCAANARQGKRHRAIGGIKLGRR